MKEKEKIKMIEENNLDGKTAFITGAGHRIGRSIALGLGWAGANIFVHYGKSKDAAEKLVSELNRIGVSAWTVGLDLADTEKIEDTILNARKIKPIDILVNNAAIFEDLDVEQTDLTAWQRHIDINLTAPFVLCRSFASQFAGNHGRIINILDWRALRPGKDHFAYTISKAGLAALTKSLAQAYAPSITVNGIALGAILPPSDGGNVDKIIEKVPMKRWADLQEVVDAVVFLASGSHYITGEIIHLDGGRHLT